MGEDGGDLPTILGFSDEWDIEGKKHIVGTETSLYIYIYYVYYV